jgi:opacity protein-like surface antigen
MASFRAVIIAGAVAIGAVNAAYAADLDLPPPPPVEAPPPAPIVGGGWYLRGDVGVGIANVNNVRSSFDADFAPGVIGDQFNSQSVGDAAIIGFGAGYQFNQWLRFDGTAEYRSNANYHVIESAIFQCGGIGVVRCHDNDQGSVSSAVFLANGYVDLGTWWGVTPFVGAGVGGADNFFQSITDTGEAGGFGYGTQNSSFSLAWAAMAGLDFSITPNMKLEFSYRYLSLGTPISGPITCQNTPACGHEVQRFDLTSNDIRIGVRYIFAEVPPPAPSLPLVTKY